jgi:hypothetical protein
MALDLCRASDAQGGALMTAGFIVVFIGVIGVCWIVTKEW